MKKSMFFIAVFMLFAAAAKSQHVSYVAWSGAYQHWNVPIEVSEMVYYRYHNYDWVNTQRVVRNGHVRFKVLLQRGPLFTEVTMNRFGRVRRVRHFDYYPSNAWGYYYNYNGPTHVNVIKKHYYHYDNNYHVQHHNKQHKKKSTYHDDRYRRPDPIVVKQRAPQRRQGTMKEIEEDRRRRVKVGSRSGERTNRSRRVE